MPVKMVLLHRVILTRYTASHVVQSGITIHCHSLENLRNHTIHQNIGHQENESYLH